MRLKLDENLGRRCIDILSADGHDVATVSSQSMTAAEDSEVIEACRREGRALITLDLDFSNPLIFPPHQFAGIAVLRLRPKASHPELVEVVRTLAAALRHEDLAGKLWSVEAGRIRVYSNPKDP